LQANPNRVKGGSSVRATVPAATRNCDNKQLIQFVSKALKYGRAEVMKHRLFGTLLMGMRFKSVPGLGTYATNGRDLFYDPFYVATRWKRDEVAADLAHEVGHKMLGHFLRVQLITGDFKVTQKFNYAADLALNSILKDEGFNIDSTFLYEAKYHNWSLERIYKDLNDHDIPPEVPIHVYACPAAGDPDKEDAPPPNAEEPVAGQEELEAANEQLTVQLIAAFEAVGDGYGLKSQALKEMLTALTTNQVKWEEELLAEALGTIPWDYTMRTPNRRFLFHDLYLPRAMKHGIGAVYVWPDSSGSMDKNELIAVATEMKYIVERMQPEKLVVMHNDASLHGITTYYPGDSLDQIEFTGRGGTDPTPAIDYAIEQGDAHMMVCLTDMGFNYNLPKPDFPVLWVSTVKNKNPPYGKLIYINPNKS